MDEPLPDREMYENVKVETRQVGEYSVVTAEVPEFSDGRYARIHLRVIGETGTPAEARAIIYSDTYAGAPGSPTYAYARHGLDQQDFLSRLEEFVSTVLLVDFSELRGATARCVMQTAEELKTEEFQSYLDAITALKAQPLIFARLYFVFGDITMDFTAQPSLVDNDLASLSNGLLTKSVESPLFAFDASKSDVWFSFLASVHWARDLFPPEVLRLMLAMAAPVVMA
jgi:hypothetical protein